MARLSRGMTGIPEEARKKAERDVVQSVEALPDEYRKKYETKGLEVGVAVKVISISHVDMANNTFDADFNLNIAWKGEVDDKPEVQIYNMREEQDKDEADVKKGEAGFDHYYRVHFKATFRHHLKLRSFPFDVQELTVRVRFKKECTLVPLPWGPFGDAVACDPDAIEEDFILKRAEVRPMYLPSYKFGKLGGYDPEAQVVFVMKRNADYWLFNYGYLMSIVCTFAFAAFTLPVGDVGDRLGVGFTLNLTVVATFYLMQDKLPPCSYYTELERHMAMCIGFTMFVMVINCLPAVVGEDIIQRLESTIIVLLMLAWVGYHAYMMARCNAMREDGLPPSFGHTVSKAFEQLLPGATKGE